ncbi:hypothetical protein ACB092_12G067600 [Castanea dentata]
MRSFGNIVLVMLSFLQSDPPSASQSPAKFLSFTSLSGNAYSPGGTASNYTIGPYAYETQLVSPPVLSTLTTEPSTAPFTPPPESVHQTTPSSLEVPFAQLLTSSLDRSHRNSGTNQKFALSYYEFQPYQQYLGSSGGYLISPGSAISNSGTSTPFPDRRPILEFRMAESPKLLGFDHFSAHGVGLGSRLGSGSLTPDGIGLGSRLNSGSMTPDGVELGSRLGSRSLTLDVMGPASRDSYLLENQISESVSLANLGNGCQNNGTIIDHRVSLELTGEDVACRLANKSAASIRNASESSQDIVAEAPTDKEGIKTDTNNCCELPISETSNETPEKASEEGEEQSYRKHREVSDKPTISSAWWANEKVSGKEARPSSNWAFFPMLQSGVS